MLDSNIHDAEYLATEICPHEQAADLARTRAPQFTP
jgi:hypothetical protein